MWRLRRPLQRSAEAPLALALQGGGAHGAFTWGVLDALLEHTAHPIAAISGTSAGAMNAVALADGLARAGRDGARESLAAFWDAVADAAPPQWLGLVDAQGEGLSAAGQWLLAWSQWMGPGQVNPMGVNPLREVLARCIDFDRLRQTRGPQLYLAATHANTGQLRLFRRTELSVDVALASACLPMLHPTVMIDGEPYWDGGYSANPAISPLVGESEADDLLMVLLAPRRFGETPRSAADIRARVAELSFHAGFQQELLGWLHARARAAEGAWPWRSAWQRRLARLRLHLIDGHDALAHLPAASRLLAHRPLLHRLREAGREHTLQWLQGPGRALGRRSTADFSGRFGV